MKGYIFEKNVNLVLAALIVIALFLGENLIVGYLSLVFLILSVIVSFNLNLRAYFNNQTDIREEENISKELFTSKEKEVQSAALKSFKTLVCR
ncbi:MAG: hypothetical protein Q7K48_04015 [Fusobacterium sp. JB021]|nr:hypothetical protein [Fusobacterium sp. JB021]MDP0507676.1 hypothetical protein [Fusobacterium sp. JB019]